MTSIKSLIAVLAVVLSAGNANAVTIYTDINIEGVTFRPAGSLLGLPFAAVNTYTNSFDIGPAGFQPGSQTVTAANATFVFTDLFGTESFTLKVGTVPFLDVGSPGLPNLRITPLGNGLGFISLSDLNADGLIEYTIQRETGSFTLLSAQLNATVPDGGSTAMLLGAAMTGMAALRRKIAG
ncbi:MAG TPA: VPDSG-CTERM sorting domain-containing protein [Chthoniobacteraceae bacterium]|jgi:hypothetical protein